MGTKLSRLIVKLLFLSLILFVHVKTFSQTSVGINTTTPNKNAVLELLSPGKNQGFLCPRLKTSERTASSFQNGLTSSENGLLVYDSDENIFYYWNFPAWQKVSSGDIPSLSKVLTSSNDATNIRIINLKDPINLQDAVTKKYVDLADAGLMVQIKIVRDSIKIIDGKLQIIRDSVKQISTNLQIIRDSVKQMDTLITKRLDSVINNGAGLPKQIGNSGMYLKTDGTKAFWAAIPVGGDMNKSDYDKNGNLIVDDAEKINGHTVLTDVPSGAVFTDNQTLSSILMTNNSAGTNKITNVVDPTNLQDVATKNYVDIEKASIQTELDATQTGTGVNTDGSYTANGTTNYIKTATSLKDADNKLDAQVKTNADAIATNSTVITTETTARTNADNTLTTNLASEVTNRTNADASIQTELDATQAGTGVNADGSYTANGTTNYIKTATSLKDADNKLDAQVKTNADAIATNSTAITGKESAISAGLTTEYWRGDKTWQTLNTSVVPEGTNLYFTNTRAIGATLNGYSKGSGGQTVLATDNLMQAIQKLDGNISASSGVTSFNTRTGAVTLLSGDITSALGFTPYNATNPNGYISANQSITLTPDATGDVTGSASGTTLIAPTYTISANKVSNGKLAQMPALTLKGNNTGVLADASDLTVSDIKSMLGLKLTNSGDVVLAGENYLTLSGQTITAKPIRSFANSQWRNRRNYRTRSDEYTSRISSCEPIFTR